MVSLLIELSYLTKGGFMKIFGLMFSFLTLLSVAACGTDYKEKHADIDREEAQERLEDADNVKLDGDTIQIDD